MKNIDTDAFVGLTLDEANELAEQQELTVRVTREDTTHYAVTYDMQFSRINFQLDDNKITKASIG